MAKVYWEVTDETRDAACDWARSESIDPNLIKTSVVPYFVRLDDGRLQFVYAEALRHNGKAYVCAHGDDDHVASRLVNVIVSGPPRGVTV